jgi:hypothetical protein
MQKDISGTGSWVPYCPGSGARIDTPTMIAMGAKRSIQDPSSIFEKVLLDL